MCMCTVRCMKCQHIVLLIRCCNLIMTSFLFVMKNIYEYIHYIQSLKSIWTKIMSTWGCYFCCFFLLFFLIFSLSPCEVCVCVYKFFLKKILNVFQKKDKKAVLKPDIFFSSEDFRNGSKRQKKKIFKELSKDFFLQVGKERKK